MKLTTELFFNDYGNVDITEAGWIELQHYCLAIVLKHAKRHDKWSIQDYVQSCVLVCVDRIGAYNPAKNDELGGYLYWYVRGEMKRIDIDYERNIPLGNGSVMKKIMEEKHGRKIL